MIAVVRMTLVHAKYLFAVDPSLTSSGWALFSLSKNSLCGVGVICPPGPRMVLAKRYEVLQTEISELFADLGLGKGDVLVCEGPAPLVRNPQSAIKVEGVRGIFEAVARSRGMRVPGRLNPRTVQTELLGMRGPQLGRKEVKKWARETAYRLHRTQLEKLLGKLPKVSQDIIDAVLIGTLAMSRLEIAHSAGSSLESVFLAKVSMRSGRGRSGGSRRASGWNEADFRKYLNSSR